MIREMLLLMLLMKFIYFPDAQYALAEKKRRKYRRHRRVTGNGII